MDDNVMDFMAYRARAARATAVGPDGESSFNERDTQALAEHVRHVKVLYSQLTHDAVLGDDYDPDTFGCRACVGQRHRDRAQVGRVQAHR
jgi:hypothetical protein